MKASVLFDDREKMQHGWMRSVCGREMKVNRYSSENEKGTGFFQYNLNQLEQIIIFGRDYVSVAEMRGSY